MIKAIFFDAADTLFYVRDGVARVYHEVASRHFDPPPVKDIKSAFSHAFSTAPPLAFPGATDAERKTLEKGWWKGVVSRVFEGLGTFERFDEYFDELYETFRSAAWEIFPETVEVLTELRRRGYTLSIISNFDSRIYDVCGRMGITGFFDPILISSEAGVAKPASEIFGMALERHGLEPGECLHIGDSLKHDYVGARGAGLNALLLDREGEAGADVDSIGSLTELLARVD